MDRKEFLKSACGLGVCGCAAESPRRARAAARGRHRRAGPAARFRPVSGGQDGRLHGHRPTPEACAGIIEKTGRECAKLGQLQAKFKGDPEGYFAAIKKAWGTDSSWDKEKGIITVAVPEGECGCPLVDNKRTPAVWCNCSVGYQKEAFETIFGKPVRRPSRSRSSAAASAASSRSSWRKSEESSVKRLIAPDYSPGSHRANRECPH